MKPTKTDVSITHRFTKVRLNFNPCTRTIFIRGQAVTVSVPSHFIQITFYQHDNILYSDICFFMTEEKDGTQHFYLSNLSDSFDFSCGDWLPQLKTVPNDEKSALDEAEKIIHLFWQTGFDEAEHNIFISKQITKISLS